MTSKATTVEEYLSELPEDRRAAVSAVRETVRKSLPAGYEEGMQYGMIGYFVPHSIYPKGYHCDPKQPLPFASIASQKNHMAVYMFCIYCDPAMTEEFVREYKATGKKLDMGKSCIRFKKLEDLPLDLIGKTLAKMPVDAFIAEYEKHIPASAKR